MRRREMFQAVGVGAVAIGALPQWLRAAIEEPECTVDVLVVGGVAYPGLFHAWEKQVIAGIGWELVKSSVDLDSGTMPDFSVPPERHSHHQVRVNGQLYAALAEEACLEATARHHLQLEHASRASRRS